METSLALAAAGSILIEATVPSQRATTLTAPPPLLASTVREASSAWTFSIFSCMRAASLTSFPRLGIDNFLLAPDFNDLAFENFEGLLNERIVFKFLCVYRCGAWFVAFGRSHGRCRSGLGSGDGFGHWSFDWPGNGRFGLDEFNLGTGVAQLLQLRLQKGVRACVVDQFHLVRKLGIEADGQDVAGKGNGMSFQQIAARESAGPTDGVEESLPKLIEVRIDCGRFRRLRSDPGSNRFGLRWCGRRGGAIFGRRGCSCL